MKITIDLCDERDRDLLAECITMGIRDLAELRDRAASWGCSRMEMQDRIDRLQRLLRDVTGEE